MYRSNLLTTVIRFFSLNRIIGIFLLGLFFTFTNKVYVSAIPSVFFAPFLIFFFIIDSKVHKITFYLLIYFLLSFISILFYYPASFLSFSFYRYDANFIISYVPLLVLPFFSVNFNLEKVLLYFFRFVVILNVVLLLLGVNVDRGNFHSLFVAHNAAGGFFSIIVCYFLILFYSKKTKINLLYLLTSCIILASTFSRGSVIGTVLGALIFYLCHTRFKLLVYVLFIGIVFFQTFVLIKYYEGYEATKNGLIREYLRNTLQVQTSREANVYIRLLSDWPRAIDCFIHSPILGTGFGSINDMPYSFSEVVPGLSYNSQSLKTFDSSHAHHSYFHILGEQGLLGLVVFLLFWSSIYFYLQRREQTIARDFILMAFWTITISSFTEHRITTPATMIPFCIILGLYIALNNKFSVFDDASKPFL